MARSSKPPPPRQDPIYYAQAARLIQRPGTTPNKRQYLDPLTGEVFSRRQAETAQRTFGMRQKQMPSGPMTRYNNLIDHRTKALNKERAAQGLGPVKKGDVRRDPATMQAVKDLRSRPDKVVDGKKKHSPQSKKARALVYFDIRDEDNPYDVGDTPDNYGGRS